MPKRRRPELPFQDVDGHAVKPQKFNYLRGERHGPGGGALSHQISSASAFFVHPPLWSEARSPETKLGALLDEGVRVIPNETGANQSGSMSVALNLL